ncbi:hypothetical protein EDC01DRAFT_409671 [Geopyxis carbonaria]|nr:hypothetical protein EDC01DRAFT_409671 [Geopyxis carbonaria]
MINLRFILWATTLITTSSVGAQLVVPAFADSTLNGAAPTNYTNSTNLLNNTNKANETINNNTTGYNLYRCPVQNGALCLDETTIIRCVDYVATYENCNAYLLNRPPVGVKTGAVCYQPNQAVYNAACGKNGLVYAAVPQTLIYSPNLV